jgi:hypothetical protein
MQDLTFQLRRWVRQAGSAQGEHLGVSPGSASLSRRKDTAGTEGKAIEFHPRPGFERVGVVEAGFLAHHARMAGADALNSRGKRDG